MCESFTCYTNWLGLKLVSGSWSYSSSTLPNCCNKKNQALQSALQHIKPMHGMRNRYKVTWTPNMNSGWQSTREVYYSSSKSNTNQGGLELTSDGISINFLHSWLVVMQDWSIPPNICLGSVSYMMPSFLHCSTWYRLFFTQNRQLINANLKLMPSTQNISF